MNKTLLKLSAVALAALSYASLAAAETQTTVKFTGKLQDATCQIDSSSLNQEVTLPTLSTTTLNKSGAVAGATMFDVKVVDCPSTMTAVTAHFETLNMDPDTRNAKNLATTNAASNVTVQILDRDGTTAIPLGSKGQFVSVVKGGTEAAPTYSADLLYGGRYYATGATTPGNVSSTVTFTLAYQ